MNYYANKFIIKIKFVLLLIGLLIEIIAFQSALAEEQPQHYKPSVDFSSPPEAEPLPGARSLLEACWKPEALAGKPTDRTIYMNLSSVLTPPSRIKPNHTLNSLPPSFSNSIRYIIPKNKEKIVALTFDLCERANEVTGYDAKLVNILREKKVKATFFAGGKWLRTHSDKAMQLIADPLFEIGNHTWTHDNMRLISEDERLEQILWSQAQYELLREKLLNLPCAVPFRESAAANIPILPKIFRFPYGTCNKESLQTVIQSGLYPIQWNIVSGDPSRTQSAGRIVRSIIDQIRPGSIVVAHANGRGWHTAEALNTLIPELRARGYRFVTIRELLFMGQPVAAEECFETTPGDTIRYDQLFGRTAEDKN